MTANYLRAVNQSIPTWTWGITFFYFSVGIDSGLAAMADAGAVEQAMMEVASAMGFSELKERLFWLLCLARMCLYHFPLDMGNQ